MDRKRLRQAQIGWSVFIGCQFCGETNKTLRNYGGGKICPKCLMRKSVVPNSGIGKEQQ